jgi:uroporphyrinogen-III synthase
MRPLEHKRIALLESRKAADLATLIDRLGGTPISVASVREVPHPEAVSRALGGLVAGEFGILIALTGAACDALFTAAEQTGRLDIVIERLRNMTLACRGPKPLGALRRRGLAADVQTVKPHTTADLLAALSTLDLAARHVLVLMYGERNPTFVDALTARGARVTDLCPYEWALPEDVGELQRLIDGTIAGDVDAMLFTSQVQFRHLMQVAHAMGKGPALLRALRDDVVTASVGPVCTHALRLEGVIPDVMPAMPNSTALVQAVGEYMAMIGTDGHRD